jgi:hypothetical protein
MPVIRYQDVHTDNMQDVLDALKVDGHGRLEGAYFEAFTISALLRPTFGEEISTGWWFASGSSNRLLLFKLLHSEPTALDTAFLNIILDDPNITPYLVRYELRSPGISFRAREATRGMRESYGDAEALVSRLAATEARRSVIKNPPANADPGRQIESRLARVTEAVSGLGTLYVKQLLVERMFVNQILNKYYRYIYDLDAVVGYKDRIVGFELKRKYPEPATEFGINQGLVTFFLQVIRVIDVYHVILNSACWNKATSPLDMFSNAQVEQNTVWIGAQLTRRLLTNSVGRARVSAADFGLGDQAKNTPKFSVTEFSLISRLTPVDTKALELLLRGDLPKITEEFLSELQVVNC